MSTPHCTERGSDARVPWEEFLPEVLPYARNAPDNIAINEIRTAARDFCRHTGILRRILWIDLWRGVEDYPVDPPKDEEFLWLSRAIVLRHEYPLIPRWPAGGHGCGVHFDLSQRMVYVLPAPATDARDGMELEFVAMPSLGSETVDRMLLDRHADAIGQGALARLLNMKGTPWYDPNLAQMAYREYRTAFGRAKVEMERRHQSGPARLTPAYRWY